MPPVIRYDAWHDPAAREALLALFDEVWPALRPKEAHAARLGFGWREHSTPAVVYEGGRALAHAGLLAMPMRLAGRDVVVGGVHAVCTSPSARGRGLARMAMEGVLALATGRFDTLLLFTDLPRLYARFGFRVQPRHVFVAEPGPVPAHGTPLRPVTRPDVPGVACWLRALRERQPLSDEVAWLDRGLVNVFNTVSPEGWLRHLYVADDLGLAAYLHLEGGVLTIDDVLAPSRLDLHELLARVPWPFARVVLRVNAGRWPLQARAVPVEDEGCLMVRGPFVAAGTPVGCPAHAEC